MMDRTAPAMVLMALCLATVLFVAGCTSQGQGPAPQTPAQQPGVTITQAPVSGGQQAQASSAADVSSSAPDQGLVPDDTGNAVAQAESFNATQQATSAPDSEDFGDILP